jgi:heterodisulfide reductase subunit B
MPVFFATELIEAALSGSYPAKQQRVHLVPPEVLTGFFKEATMKKEGSA